MPTCSDCGSSETTPNAKGSPNWYYKHDGQLCSKCYSRKYYHEKRKQTMYEYYLNHRATILARSKARHLKNRPARLEYCRRYWRVRHDSDKLQVLSNYSIGKLACVCCGESEYEFLTIDHINGGGRHHRRTMTHSHLYKWLIDNGLPEGYQVLCYNCNCAKGKLGKCPHTLVHNTLPIILEK